MKVFAVILAVACLVNGAAEFGSDLIASVLSFSCSIIIVFLLALRAIV